MSPGVLNVNKHWIFTAIFIFSITTSGCLLLLGFILCTAVCATIRISLSQQTLASCLHKSSWMCFPSVLQPGRWQVLKANMKEEELLEGSKEFLLPDPRFLQVLEECCCHCVHCGLALCSVSWAGACSGHSQSVPHSGGHNHPKTCAADEFLYPPWPSCVSPWGFCQHLSYWDICVSTLCTDKAEVAEIWSRDQPQSGFGELGERTEPLFCHFWDTDCVLSFLGHKLCCFSGICFSYCWPITFWARSFMPNSFKILRNYSVFGKQIGLHTKLAFLKSD